MRRAAETRTPEPMQPGQPARHDYEYMRNGTANIFMLFAPLEGWRHIEVTERRTAIDYAMILRDLADIHFPGASKIVPAAHFNTVGRALKKATSNRT